MEVKTRANLWSFPGLVVDVVGTVVELEPESDGAAYSTKVETVDGAPPGCAMDLADRDEESIRTALEEAYRERMDALTALPRSVARDAEYVSGEIERALKDTAHERQAEARDRLAYRVGVLQAALQAANERVSSLRSKAKRILEAA